MKRLFFFVFVSLSAAVLGSCSDDGEHNYIQMDNNRFTIEKAARWTPANSVLASSSERTGISLGDYPERLSSGVYLDLCIPWSAGVEVPYGGKYTFDASSTAAYTLRGGEVWLKNKDTAYSIVGGTVGISQEGIMYTITLDLTVEERGDNGGKKKLTGRYHGGISWILDARR